MKKMESFGNMTELPPRELALIFRQGAVLRLPYLEGRLLQAKEQVRSFEEKYRITFDALSAKGLPEDAGYEMHEDFIEWEYWRDELKQTQLTVQNVKTLLEKTEETVSVR